MSKTRGPVFSTSSSVSGSSWLWKSIDAHDAASARASSPTLRRSDNGEVSTAAGAGRFTDMAGPL